MMAANVAIKKKSCRTVPVAYSVGVFMEADARRRDWKATRARERQMGKWGVVEELRRVRWPPKVETRARREAMVLT